MAKVGLVDDSGFAGNRRLKEPRRLPLQDPYLKELATVKKERGPVSERFLTHPESTNPDGLNAFSKSHIQGTTIGSLISELLRGNPNHPFHGERIEIKEFMRGLVSALKLNLIGPLLKALCGKQGPRIFKPDHLRNRLTALKAEMAPLLSCLEGSNRRDTEALAKRLATAMKHDCKNLNKQIQHTPPAANQQGIRRHLLAEKNVAEGAVRLLSLAA